jgi:hypothetical protein
MVTDEGEVHGFGNTEIRDMHEHGWAGTFDSLERYLAA